MRDMIDGDGYILTWNSLGFGMMDSRADWVGNDTMIVSSYSYNTFVVFQDTACSVSILSVHYQQSSQPSIYLNRTFIGYYPRRYLIKSAAGWRGGSANTKAL